MIRIIRAEGEPIPEFKPIMLEPVTDPDEIARSRATCESFQRNADWLEAHWPDLLPQALGKYLVVAGQQPFLADSPEEALTLARTAHPEDTGMFGQYVSPHMGPKIYAIRG